MVKPYSRKVVMSIRFRLEPLGLVGVRVARNLGTIEERFRLPHKALMKYKVIGIEKHAVYGADFTQAKAGETVGLLIVPVEESEEEEDD